MSVRLKLAVQEPKLLGRQELFDCLGRMVRNSVANGVPSAAIFIDLNNFSEINASLGPEAGNEVLQSARERLLATANSSLSGDTGEPPAIGHLDGDHFAILLPGVRRFGRLAACTAEVLKQLAAPFNVGGRSVTVTGRAAIVQIPLHGRTVSSVLARGFRLLNGVARTKADGVILSTGEAGSSISPLELDRDLHAALATDQISLALQPKVDIASGAIRSAEALVRWTHPRHGALPPSMFVEAAEKGGLILNLACAFFAKPAASRTRCPGRARISASPSTFHRVSLFIRIS